MSYESLIKYRKSKKNSKESSWDRALARRGYEKDEDGNIVVELRSPDGKRFGKVTTEALKAVEGFTLDSYQPKNEKEKSALTQFKNHLGTTLSTEDGITFGNVSYDAYHAIVSGKLDSYQPKNEKEKSVIEDYKNTTAYGKDYFGVSSEYKKNKLGKGNLDLTSRPVLVNDDGSISTVDTISIGVDGKEVLIPTIVTDANGKAKRLTNEEAEARYYQTGEHFGVFDSVEEANKYATKLHLEQDLYYDFLKNKQYKSSKNGKEAKFNAWTGTYTETGYDDILHDYINKDKDAMSKVGLNETQNNATFLGYDSSFLKNMTQEEIDTYNYYYNVYGKEAGKKYIDAITPGLKAEARQKLEKELSDYAKEHKVKASVATVVGSPLKVISALGTVADYADDGKIDQNSGYNKYVYGTNAIRSTVSDEIEKTRAGKVGSFLYNTGMSIGDSTMGTVIGGGNSFISLGTMGIGAFANSVVDAKDRGLSDDKAMLLGALSGATEIFTENFSLKSLKGAFSAGKVAGKNATTSVKSYILDNIKTNALEELGAEGLNFVSDVIISKDLSQWQQTINKHKKSGKSDSEAFGLAFRDTALQFASSALAGALSGAAMSGSSATFLYNNISNVGRDNSANVLDVINEGLSYGENTEAYKNAVNLFKNNTDTDYYQIGQQVLLNNTQKINTAIEKGLSFDKSTEAYKNAKKLNKSKDVSGEDILKQLMLNEATERGVNTEETESQNDVSENSTPDTSVETTSEETAPAVGETAPTETPSAKVGDILKDTKTGYNATITARDAENTTITIDRGTSVETKVVSNEQLDNVIARGQLEKTNTTASAPKNINLRRVGKNYEVYGNDALTLASEIDNLETTKGVVNGVETDILRIPANMADDLAKAFDGEYNLVMNDKAVQTTPTTANTTVKSTTTESQSKNPSVKVGDVYKANGTNQTYTITGRNDTHTTYTLTDGKNSKTNTVSNVVADTVFNNPDKTEGYTKMSDTASEAKNQAVPNKKDAVKTTTTKNRKPTEGEIAVVSEAIKQTLTAESKKDLENGQVKENYARIAVSLINVYGEKGTITEDFASFFADGGKKVDEVIGKVFILRTMEDDVNVSETKDNTPAVKEATTDEKNVSEPKVLKNQSESDTIKSKAEETSVEREGNDNESIREGLLHGDGKRRGNESTRKQTERLLSFRRKNQGKNETERRDFARELIERGQVEEVVDGNYKYILVNKDAYNDDMLSMVKEAKKHGIELVFCVDEMTAEVTLDDGTKVTKNIRGLKISPTQILVRYDANRAPQQIFKHEYVHAKYKTPAMQKIKNFILGSLSEETKQDILSQERYANYAEAYRNNKEKVWEEFVCDVMSGMSDYAERFADTVVDYWEGNETADSYNVAEYAESIDAGGKYDLSDEGGELDGYEQTDNSKKLGQFKNSSEAERLNRVGEMGQAQPQKPNSPKTKNIHRSGVSAETITSSDLTAEQAALKEQNRVEKMSTEFYVKATENGVEQSDMFITENTVYYPDSAFERNDISVKNGVASFTEKRFDDLIGEYSMRVGGQLNGDYAQAYVAYISPSDFLSLTTVNESLIVQDSKRYGNLDVETLRNNDVREGMYLEIDFEDGVVVDHNGRHRMVMLRDAGVEKVAIVVKDLDYERNKYKTQKMTNVSVTGQKFRKTGTAPGKVTLDEIIPLSPNYRNEVREKFVDNDADVRYDIDDADTNGNTLTEAQQEYFKDSKVRDENGNLLVVYHGTRNKDFTVFKRNHNYYTDNRAMADSYAPSGAVYEGYLNITNPYIIDADGSKWSAIPISNEVKKMLDEAGSSTFKERGKWCTSVADIVSAISDLVDEGNADYDGVIVRNVDDTGSYYKGSSKNIGNDYITFKSAQFKNTDNLNPTENEDIRFDLSEPVEETKNLVAVHNMQVSELERTLDLGGLPMPSIAIIKAQRGHSEYGDVSLVFNKETIDPKANKSNKVYGGDAWTPTYPTIEYKPNEKVAKKISDKYYELSRKFGYDESRPLYNYVNDLERQLNTHKGEAEMINELYDDTKLMQLYLLDSGKSKVETVKKETRTELTDAEVKMHEFFINELGAEVVDEVKWDGKTKPQTYRKNYMSKYEGAIREAYKKLLSQEYQFTEEEVQNVLDSTKTVNYLNFVREAQRYRENGRVTIKTEDDYNATEQAIRDAVGDDYRKWVDSLFKGIEEKSGIRNNVDYFTNSGNRRSWEALHWENNLENVVKVMKSQEDVGGGFFGGQGIWGVSAKDFKSIEEIKADSNRLKQMPEEEYQKIKDSFGDRMSEVAHSIMDKSERNPFIAVDNAMECIVDAVRHSKSRLGILKNLKQYQHLTVTEKTVKDIISLVSDIANMPTEYFEAKPKRAVELNEIATAIIPDTTSGEIKSKLDDMGIKYLEYESGNEDSRLDALNSLEDVRFDLSESDAEYMKAVESGDTETVSKMIEEAAEKAFPDSKVRESNGKLKLVYHGRVSDFNVFDRSFANVEGDFGKGYYFTSNEYDVDANYANEEGPDLKIKIAHYAEQLEFDDEYSDLSYEEREEIARQKFITSEPNTITAYLNMENPVYITPDEKGTLLDYAEEYDEEYDEYSEPEGLLIDFVEALNNIASDYAYNDVDFNFLYEYAYDDGGVYASDAVKIIKRRITDELTDEEGNIATNEVIRLAFEEIGFDGIIDTSVYYKFRNMYGMDSGTTHYIVFNSNQIKSADLVTYDDDGNIIPPSQRFNDESDDIRYDLAKDNNLTTQKRIEEIANDVVTHEELIELAKKNTKEFVGKIRENESLQKRLKNAKRQMLVSPNPSVNVVKVGQVTKDILKEMDSTLKATDLKDDIMSIYNEYVQAVKKASGVESKVQEANDNMTKRFAELAVDIADSSEVYVESEMYSLLKSYIKDTRIKIPDHAKEEADYAEFRKSHMGTFNLTNDGLDIDVVYQELCSMFPGMFSTDVASPADQLHAIAEKLESLKPYAYNPHSDYMQDAIEHIVYRFVSEVDGIAANPKTKAQKMAEKASVDKAKAIDKERTAFERKLEKHKKNSEKTIQKLQKKIDDSNYVRYWEKRLGKEEKARAVQEVRDRQKKALLKSRIRSIVSDMKKKLDKSEKTGGYPKELVKTVAEVCSALDFHTGKTNKDGSPTKTSLRLDSLMAEYNALKNNENYDFASEYRQELSDKISNLYQAVKDKRVVDLNLNELSELKDILSEISHSLSIATQQIGKANAKANAELAWGIIESVDEKSDLNDMNKRLLMREGKLEMQSTKAFILNPHRINEMIAGYDKESVWWQLHDDINRGNRKSARFVMEANKPFDELTDDGGNEIAFYDFRTEKIKTGIKYTDGTEVEIPKSIICEMLMMWNRKDGKTHLETGGAKIPDIELYNKGKTIDAIKGGKRTNPITVNDIVRLRGLLDSYDLAWIERAHHLFNKVSQDAINSTSIELVGRELARSENYIRMYVDSDFIGKEVGKDENNNITLEGHGSLKETKPKAKQPLLFRGIHENVYDNIDFVSKYYGLAIPIRNFNKVYRMTFRDENGQSSVQEVIGKKFGAKIQIGVVEQYIKDLQTPRKKEYTKFDTFKGNWLGATFWGNVSSALKQTSSYWTGSALLGEDSLVKGLKNFAKNAKQTKAEIDKYSGTLYKRSQGLSTTELGDRANRKRLAGASSKVTKLINEKAPILRKIPQGIRPGNWLQSMDINTSAALWEACKLEVAKTMKTSDDEYMQAVTDLWERVIEETQSNYDVAHRPESLKSTNVIVQTLTMFTTDVQQKFGLLFSAYNDYATKAELLKKDGSEANENAKKEASKRLSKASRSIAYSALWMGFVSVIGKAVLRKFKDFIDDEEQDITASSVAEQYVKIVGEDLFNTIMPIGSSIILQAVDTFNNGYDFASVPSFDVVEDFIVSLSKVYKASTNDEEGDVLKALADSAYAISNFTGVPVKNVTDIIKSIKGYAGDIKELDFAHDIADYRSKQAIYTHGDLAECIMSGKSKKEQKILNYYSASEREISKGTLTKEIKPAYVQMCVDSPEKASAIKRKLVLDYDYTGDSIDSWITEEWVRNVVEDAEYAEEIKTATQNKWDNISAYNACRDYYKKIYKKGKEKDIKATRDAFINHTNITENDMTTWEAEVDWEKQKKESKLEAEKEQYK